MPKYKETYNKRSRPSREVYVNGEVFTIAKLRAKIEAEGGDVKKYRTHPDYLAYMKGIQELRKADLQVKKDMMMTGEMDPRIPLTKHPDAVNAHLADEGEQAKKIEYKVRKTSLETLDSLDIVKKIAKSKISKEIQKKIRARRVLKEEDTKKLDLGTLQQITRIISEASRAQLEVATKILDVDSRKAIKNGLKKEILKEKKNGNEDPFDFNQIGYEKHYSEEAIEGNVDVYTTISKLFDN